MSKKLYFCGKCLTQLSNPLEMCPYCSTKGDVYGVSQLNKDIEKLANETYDFLVNEDMRLETVKRELIKIEGDRDKFIQKLEKLLENSEEE